MMISAALMRLLLLHIDGDCNRDDDCRCLYRHVCHSGDGVHFVPMTRHAVVWTFRK